MTKTERAAARARCEAATEGPWFARNHPGSSLDVEWGDNDERRPICHMRWTDGMRPVVEQRVKSDAEFVSAARTDLPAALDEIERLRTALEFYRDGNWSDGYPGGVRVECADGATALDTGEVAIEALDPAP